MNSTVTMDWDHPRKGRIREHLCDPHEQEVLRALNTLGIGSLGRRSDGQPCPRCTHSGSRFGTYIDQLVAITPF